MAKDIVYIYALCEPETLEVRYIGKSSNPQKRYSAHLLDKKKTYKRNWIIGLRRLNKLPVMRIIEECHPDDVDFREQYWIQCYRGIGARLTNSTDGGEGLLHPSPETLKKMSERLRGRAPSFLGRKHSESAVRKIIEVHRKLSMDEVYQIRKLLSENNRLGYQDIGKMFNVSDGTIRRIGKGLGYDGLENDGFQERIDFLYGPRKVFSSCTISDKDVVRIRGLRNSGETIRGIIEITGYSYGAIWMIVNRKRYWWVE